MSKGTWRHPVACTFALMAVVAYLALYGAGCGATRTVYVTDIQVDTVLCPPVKPNISCPTEPCAKPWTSEEVRPAVKACEAKRASCARGVKEWDNRWEAMGRTSKEFRSPMTGERVGFFDYTVIGLILCWVFGATSKQLSVYGPGCSCTTS